MTQGASPNPYAAPQSPMPGLPEPFARNRWIGMVLGLVAPPIAMLYVGRPLRALGYLSASLLALAATLIAAIWGSVDPLVSNVIGSVALSLAGAVDGYRFARSFSRPALPWYSRAPALAGFLLAGWLTVTSARAFIIEPFRIASSSMAPTLHRGDHIVVNKRAYGLRNPFTDAQLLHLRSPRRGEVAVFRFPDDRELSYVMRVVGVPGDTVGYAKKHLSVNGTDQPMQEQGPVVIANSRGGTDGLVQYTETLDGHAHAILLDPSAPALHSPAVRAFRGRENCRLNDDGLLCKVPEGHYFVLGDNRDNSSDSRYWGFVPEEDFVGRADMVWYSAQHPERAGQAVR